jgi:hypothetical protein
MLAMLMVEVIGNTHTSATCNYGNDGSSISSARGRIPRFRRKRKLLVGLNTQPGINASMTAQPTTC